MGNILAAVGSLITYKRPGVKQGAYLAVKDVARFVPGLLQQLQRRVLSLSGITRADGAVTILHFGIGQLSDQRNPLPSGKACMVHDGHESHTIW
jgi:hypothetical protein